MFMLVCYCESCIFIFMVHSYDCISSFINNLSGSHSELLEDITLHNEHSITIEFSLVEYNKTFIATHVSLLL